LEFLFPKKTSEWGEQRKSLSSPKNRQDKPGIKARNKPGDEKEGKAWDRGRSGKSKSIERGGSPPYGK